MMKPEEKIVEELASEIGKRITRKTIRDLQKMGEEFMICVQVQYESSLLWELYDETVRLCVAHFVSELKYYERFALWFQTEDAHYWKYEDDEEQKEGPALSEEEIVNYVVNDYVYFEAGRWSNQRIRAYLEG